MLIRLHFYTLFPYTTLFRSNWIQLVDPVTGKEQFTLIRSVYDNYQLVGVLLIAVSDKVFDDALADSNNHIFIDRKSTRLNSSHVAISYAVFCLKKKIDMEI